MATYMVERATRPSVRITGEPPGSIPDALGARVGNVLTGETVEVGLTAEGRGLALRHVLASVPVALLETAA